MTRLEDQGVAAIAPRRRARLRRRARAASSRAARRRAAPRSTRRCRNAASTASRSSRRARHEGGAAAVADQRVILDRVLRHPVCSADFGTVAARRNVERKQQRPKVSFRAFDAAATAFTIRSRATSWPRPSATSSSSGFISGACGGFTAIPATASTACSARCSGPRARSSSSRCGMRKWPRSWPRRMPNSPANSGVCIATSGPGATHLLNGLYDARLDHMPVLAIAGQQARTAIGGHYQQEVDLAGAVQGCRRRLCRRPRRCRRRFAI